MARVRIIECTGCLNPLVTDLADGQEDWEGIVNCPDCLTATPYDDEGENDLTDSLTPEAIDRLVTKHRAPIRG